MGLEKGPNILNDGSTAHGYDPLAFKNHDGDELEL